MSENHDLVQYNMETLFQDAKRYLKTIDGVSDPIVAESHIEKLLTKHLRINIRCNRISDLTPDQFERLKTNCLTTIQLAYLTVCDEIAQNQVQKDDDTTIKDGWVQLSHEEIATITKQVETEFHRAFWNNLSGELKEVPLKTDYLLILLREVRERLDRLTPNNHQVLNVNRELFDLDYLRSQFSRTDNGWIDLYSNSGFVKLLGGLVHFLVEDRFQKMVAPIYDEELKEWWVTTQLLMNGKKPVYEVVPEVLKGVYHWLEVIENGVIEFHKHHSSIYKNV